MKYVSKSVEHEVRHEYARGKKGHQLDKALHSHSHNEAGMPFRGIKPPDPQDNGEEHHQHSDHGPEVLGYP
jgi:hypothetical protein